MTMIPPLYNIFIFVITRPTVSLKNTKPVLIMSTFTETLSCVEITGMN